MHELSIIEDIFPVIDKVAKKNRLKSVGKVCLQVGGLQHVVEEFLQFAFETVAKDTIASGAELVIEFIPITALCRKCGKKISVNENIYICPYCDSSNLEILTGKEIVLANIEGEI